MTELSGATPYFEVFDMIASVAFYRDRLGFEVTFASPEVETRKGASRTLSCFAATGRG